MDSGTGDKIKGRVKKATGELINDPHLKDEGRVDEAAGKVKSGVDKVRDVLNKDDPARDRNRNRP